ncbi:OCIA domain-containing protein 2 [Electrophorus electricus]|uniref:OCIA domain-containing protein 2 n=1 Tax=Electrophorus electricus TaxID=8005 RepID=UPI000F0A951D|nr:OCIA domain-containing protein 2 [Electrophorus electricus]
MSSIWRERNEESFWYRALPLSLGSMAVTAGLIYNGVWKPSKRFGPFPKLALAGVLGFLYRSMQGEVSEVGTRVQQRHSLRLVSSLWSTLVWDLQAETLYTWVQ